MIKYAVFDWDGTLADTYPVLYQAYTLTSDALNLPKRSLSEIKTITGKIPNRETFAYLYEKKSDMAKTIFYDYIDRHHLDGLKPIDGAKEVLDFCLQNNITPLLITNKTEKYLKKELKFLGFQKYFKKIVCAGRYEQDKPGIKACLALFDGLIPPSDEIVVIGDGASDIAVAKVYGAKSIIYQNKAKGDYNIDTLSQAIEIMKRL